MMTATVEVNLLSLESIPLNFASRPGTAAVGNEEQTDGALDKGSDFVGEKTGGQHEDKSQQGRDVVDGKGGEENH